MKSLIIWLVLIVSTTSIIASSVLKVDFDSVVKNSEIVFQGKATSKEVRKLPNGQPMTFIIFRIDDLIKGSYTKSTIELGFLGGTINGETMRVSDLIMPKLNEYGIYFVESISRIQINPLYGWNQGHYLIKTDDNGKKTIHKIISDIVYKPTGSIQSSSFASDQIEVNNSLFDFKKKINNILSK